MTLAGALAFSSSGHDRSNPPLPSPPAPRVNPASIPLPPEIADPAQYRRVLAARKEFEMAIVNFERSGMPRFKEAIGLSFPLGGKIALVPPSKNGEPGQCSIQMSLSQKKKNLPELLHLMQAGAHLLRTRARYEPCEAAIEAEPWLAEPLDSAQLKQRVIDYIASRGGKVSPELIKFLDFMMSGPFRAFCDCYGNRDSGCEPFSIASGTYTIPTSIGNVSNGPFEIAVENSHSQQSGKSAELSR